MNKYISVQQIKVKWNNMISQAYTSNGVKQEGCLLLTMFGTYLYKLSDILKQSNIGCCYGNYYMEVFYHALLWPFKQFCKIMLKIRKKYANRYLINYVNQLEIRWIYLSPIEN